MSKIRKRLSNTEAEMLGLKVKPKTDSRNPRYVITRDQFLEVLQLRGALSGDDASLNDLDNDTVTNQYGEKAYGAGDVQAETKVYLSAFVNGKMLNIKQYCEHYDLDYENMRSYKFVMFPVPYYNIAFKTAELEPEVQVKIEAIFDEAAKRYASPVEVQNPMVVVKTKDIIGKVDRLVYSDVHIGMNPNGEKNNTMYKTDWDRISILHSADKMAHEMISRQSGNVLVIDELGDLMDGWDGHTVRKGHSLPQLMSNEEAFDCALEFKMALIDELVPYYDKIICNNVCEDNHAGAFGYVVNSAFKSLAEAVYGGKVVVFNRTEFITHYDIAGHLFLLCHGKDSSHLKFGFKPQLDARGMEKIDQYLKHHNLYSFRGKIEFTKGDSHQALLDYCTSDDFDYVNAPALAPSSDWIKVNFKKGRRGFLIQHIDPHSETKVVTPVFI